MWIGNSKSVTAAHKDNFENIYVQICGRKHFVLLSPLHHHCMNEKLLAPATYARDSQGLSLRLDDDPTPVPFATWDPDHPGENPTRQSRLAQPIRVTLEPGDMLYLPALWYASFHCFNRPSTTPLHCSTTNVEHRYHKVTQSVAKTTPTGFIAAINYW